MFDGQRAVAAELQSARERVCINVREEIIVACGAIRSPQLLQLSGIGPAPLLKSLNIPLFADRPGVGRNLRDHYSVRVTQRVRGIGTLNERTHGLALAAR